MSETSAFGTPNRNSHDASKYYDRPLPGVEESPDVTLGSRPRPLNKIWCMSSVDMRPIPDNSIGLMFTSPPYHVGKDYDTDDDWGAFLDMLGRVFAECHRVLEPGGKAVVNVANLGRKPYIRFTDIISTMMTQRGFLPRAEIIWQKAVGSGSTAWGTWRSPANPTTRDLHEYLLVFSKGRWGRVRKGKSTINKEDFMRDTLSIWNERPESAKRVGHPAPFSVPLAERVINLYSWEEDIVLDPFLGSGTTAMAAENLGRDWVGFENNIEYSLLADQRIRSNRTKGD